MLAGGAEIGATPCHATVTRYSLLGRASTQPRAPSIAPVLTPPIISAAPCRALHHCAESNCWRAAPAAGVAHTTPVPSGLAVPVTYAAACAPVVAIRLTK